MNNRKRDSGSRTTYVRVLQNQNHRTATATWLFVLAAAAGPSPPDVPSEGRWGGTFPLPGPTPSWIATHPLIPALLLWPHVWPST